MLEHGRGVGRWALEPVTRTATAGGAPESTLDPSDLLNPLARTRLFSLEPPRPRCPARAPTEPFVRASSSSVSSLTRSSSRQRRRVEPRTRSRRGRGARRSLAPSREPVANTGPPHRPRSPGRRRRRRRRRRGASLAFSRRVPSARATSASAVERRPRHHDPPPFRRLGSFDLEEPSPCRLRPPRTSREPS